MQPRDLTQIRTILRGIGSLNSISKQKNVLAMEIEKKESDLERLRLDLQNKEATLNSSIVNVAVCIRDLQTQEVHQNAGVEEIFLAGGNILQEFEQTSKKCALGYGSSMYLSALTSSMQITEHFLNDIDK